ncbi:MAG: hypothetical protein KatS3mg028_1120 [Bacteroidia bacterium]|nr:MAG: hypothetical protein KatS3mg028_1120 [Bacteroidia bacterium]
MGVFLSYSLWSQIPAGTDAQHATVILLNTDSVYSQNRSQGWFSFTTSSVNSVSGNVTNLKSVLIPKNHETPVRMHNGDGQE